LSKSKINQRKLIIAHKQCCKLYFAICKKILYERIYNALDLKSYVNGRANIVDEANGEAGAAGDGKTGAAGDRITGDEVAGEAGDGVAGAVGDGVAGDRITGATGDRITGDRVAGVAGAVEDRVTRATFSTKTCGLACF
jgi:hypothetical protein